MTPYAYVIDINDWDLILKPTLEAVVAHLRQCNRHPYDLLRNPPAVAHFADGTKQRVDLSPFIHEIALSFERVEEMRAALEIRFEESRADYHAALARLKPGERLQRYSGQGWLCECDFEETLARQIRHEATRWKEPV